jgi:hypothetical protein
MERETYNSRLKTNPEDIPVGSLLRVKKHCRKNNIVRENGEFAILVERDGGKYISHDVFCFVSLWSQNYFCTDELGGSELC